MRVAVLAMVSVIALAACSPGGGTSGNGASNGAQSGSSGSGIPDGAGVSFRQEASMTINGTSIPEVLYHDGGKIRTEMTSPMGNTVMVVNNDTHEGFTLATIAGRTIATRMDLTQQASNPATQDQVAQMRAQMQGRVHQIGTCSAAGETGNEYEMPAPEGTDTTNAQPRSMCVTHDGIMLQMKMNGAVVFDTTSIQRGPQDASLFVPPAGVQFTTVHAPSQSQINDMVARAKAAANGTH